MPEDFTASALMKVISVGFLSATASYMFMPLIFAGVVDSFTASFMGVLISLPLIIYFLEVPSLGFDFKEYYRARRLRGLIADLLMMLLSAFAPGIIFLYGLIRMRLLPPVPVAFAASIAVFTGYSAFLYRNRKFFIEDRIDIEL